MISTIYFKPVHNSISKEKVKYNPPRRVFPSKRKLRKKIDFDGQIVILPQITQHYKEKEHLPLIKSSSQKQNSTVVCMRKLNLSLEIQQRSARQKKPNLNSRLLYRTMMMFKKPGMHQIFSK